MGGISDFPAGITPDGFPPKPTEHALFRYNFTTGKIEWVPETDYTGGGGGAAWGDITGTLSDQTDLQTALNNKQDAITLSLIPCSGKASAILAASQAIDGTHKMPLGTPTVGGTPSWLAVAGDTATITGAGIYEISVDSYVLANGTRTTPIGRLSVAGTLEGPLPATGYIRNSNAHVASSLHIASHLVEIVSGSKTIEFWYGNGASVVSSNFSVPAGTSQMVIKKVI